MASWPILSFATFLPLVGVALILLFCRGNTPDVLRNVRYISLWTTLVTFVLTLPLTILTLGLLLLVLNAAMLGLTAYFLHGLSVDGFMAAVLGAIVISLVSWVGHLLLGQAGRK